MVITLSLWSNFLKEEQLDSLQKNIDVDTLIIGGGITGLTTLYYLRNKESVCLVEANSVGNGVSKNTTGKITYLQNTIYSDLTNNISLDVANDYYHSQRQAIKLITDIIKKEKISCYLEKVDSYVFTNKYKEIKKLKQEKEFLISKNILVKENTLPKKYPYLYAIGVSDTYVFHPLLFLNHLKKLLKDKIYENTKIVKIKKVNDKYICFSNNFKIVANKVIMACHYPFFLFPFLLPLKSHIEKSYIVVRKVKTNPKISGITVSNPGMSFRYFENEKAIYEICLSASNKTAKRQNDLKNFQNVIETFNIKKEEIVTQWSNVDIITDDLLPYIGEIKKQMYLATGFNTWGMTNGVLAGFMLSREVLGDNTPYKDLFSLKRSDFYQVKNFLPNLFNSVSAFVKSKIRKKTGIKVI